MLKLIVLNDIVKTNNDGTKTVLAKNVRSTVWVYPNDIRSVSQLLRDRKRIHKNKCEIYVENLGNLIVDSKPEVLVKQLTNRKVSGYV